MASASGSNPGFYRSIRFFAALNAREEIFHVIDGPVPIALCAEDRILVPGHVLPINSESAAVNLQCCVGAPELQTSVIDRSSSSPHIRHRSRDSETLPGLCPGNPTPQKHICPRASGPDAVGQFSWPNGRHRSSE